LHIQFCITRATNSAPVTTTEEIATEAGHWTCQGDVALQTQRDNNSSSNGSSGSNGLIVSSDLGQNTHAADSTSYSSALAFDPSVNEQDYASALRAEFNDASDAANGADTDSLSVYVHLPFCPSRCLTCDHHTSVSHDHREIDRYLTALENEVTLVSEHLGSRRRLQQVHLGGGTPNYLTDVQLVRLIDILDRFFIIDESTETSLEANAHRASATQLSLLHGLGFRSLNLEIRDLDPGVQQALGRHQSLPVIRDVIDTARNLGFGSISTDLVYGLPMQNASSIESTVSQLRELDPDRIACYNYSRRPNRFQHQLAVDERQMPSLADRVSIFSRIVDGLCGSGYDWVGLDCFAKTGDPIAEAQRNGMLHRNRIGYTAKAGRTLIGFGSSSVSDLANMSVQNHADIGTWRDSLENGQLPIFAGSPISPLLRARRHALSDLMCNLRIENADSTLLSDGGEDPALQALREDGLVEIDGSNVSITEAGRYTLHQLWGDASPTYRWSEIA
jgi:oxygen-independent coproporphyrinogen-3 oxidase